MATENNTEKLIEREQLDAQVPADGSAETSAEITGVGEVIAESVLALEGLEKVVLKKTSNIQGVANLTKKIVYVTDNNDTIEIDGSQVESIDTSTLQVLVATAREANQLHKEFVIDKPSEGFIDAARILGVAEDLALS